MDELAAWLEGPTFKEASTFYLLMSCRDKNFDSPGQKAVKAGQVPERIEKTHFDTVSNVCPRFKPDVSYLAC